MSWTYTNNPSASPLDEARFLIGDTIETDPLLTDEEINYTLSEEGTLYIACAVCCEALARKFSRDVSNQMGRDTFKVEAQQKADAFAKRAVELRQLAGKKGAPYSIANDATVTRQPIFTHDMMTNTYEVN